MKPALSDAVVQKYTRRLLDDVERTGFIDGVPHVYAYQDTWRAWQEAYTKYIKEEPFALVDKELLAAVTEDTAHTLNEEEFYGDTLTFAQQTLNMARRLKDFGKVAADCSEAQEEVVNILMQPEFCQTTDQETRQDLVFGVRLDSLAKKHGLWERLVAKDPKFSFVKPRRPRWVNEASSSSDPSALAGLKTMMIEAYMGRHQFAIHRARVAEHREMIDGACKIRAMQAGLTMMLRDNAWKSRLERSEEKKNREDRYRRKYEARATLQCLGGEAATGSESAKATEAESVTEARSVNATEAESATEAGVAGCDNGRGDCHVC